MWDEIDQEIEYHAIVILVICNVICWGASSLFHCVPWKPKQEIFMQRVGKSPSQSSFSRYHILILLCADHSAVFVQIAGNTIPIAMIALHQMPIEEQSHTIFLPSSPTADATSFSSSTFSPSFRFFFFCNSLVILSFASYGIWHVFTHRGQRLSYWIFMIILCTPSFPIIAAYMTIYERSLYCLSIFLLLIGALLFRSKLRGLHAYPLYEKISLIFGYHELFHVFTVLVSVCIYLVINSLTYHSYWKRCALQATAYEKYWILKLWKEVLINLWVTEGKDFCVQYPSSMNFLMNNEAIFREIPIHIDRPVIGLFNFSAVIIFLLFNYFFS